MTNILIDPANGLAEYLESQERRTVSPGVIPVRDTGTRPPLFLVHDVSGLDLYCSVMAAGIDPDIPVYALSAVPLEDPQLRTIEGMATRLVEIIRAAQPQGPYRIAGWSFGGVLAYEVAVQLLGRDEGVDFLGLIDAYEPGYWREAVSISRTAEDALSAELPAETLARLERYGARVDAHGDALRLYAAHSVSIPVHLFTAHEPTAGITPSPFCGWESVLPKERLVVKTVPGDHRSMIAHRELGEAISSACASARASQAVSKETYAERCMTLQMGKPGNTPVFCLPGAGDNVVNFVSLSGALGQARPVYGLQPRGLDALSEPHSTVDAAAQAYIAAIASVHPRGPVHLIGHSFGGWVAFEIAQRLRASGREVASLTLIDSDIPGVRREFTSTGALREWIDAVEMAAERSLDIDDATLDRLSTTAQLQLLHERLVAFGMMPRNSGAKTLLGPIRTFAAALRASFVPRAPYELPMRYVLVNDSKLDRDANARRHAATIAAWSQFAPRVQAWEGPGNHITVLKMPHVQQVGDWWKSQA